MEIAIIIFQQILTMALYMMAGFALFKTGKISVSGSKTIANILLWIIVSLFINNLSHNFLLSWALSPVENLGDAGFME